MQVKRCALIMAAVAGAALTLSGCANRNLKRSGGESSAVSALSTEETSNSIAESIRDTAESIAENVSESFPESSAELPEKLLTHDSEPDDIIIWEESEPEIASESDISDAGDVLIADESEPDPVSADEKDESSPGQVSVPDLIVDDGSSSGETSKADAGTEGVNEVGRFGDGGSSDKDTDGKESSKKESDKTKPETVVNEEKIRKNKSSKSEDTSESESLSGHVKGIREFSVIEGMKPDVMAGVSWDESIESVEADSNGVNWEKAGTQKLKFLITGKNGSQEVVSINVRINPDLDMCLYGMEGNVVIEPGDTFDPMENVSWTDDIASVTADMSALDTSVPGIYLISYTLTAPDGRTQTTVRQVTVSDGSFNGYNDEYYEALNNYSSVTDLGLWRLTAYMDTPEDQGPYVGQTASGRPLIAGRTVAVSQATCARLGLSFGDRLLIDGHIYVLEDYGGSAMNDQNWVDIFVDNPVDEYSDRFNRYTQVYLLR